MFNICPDSNSLETSNKYPFYTDMDKTRLLSADSTSTELIYIMATTPSRDSSLTCSYICFTNRIIILHCYHKNITFLFHISY